jgi:hypothetical protein
MKYIAITRGYRLAVDDEDFERFGGEHWQAIVRNGRFYGAQRIEYLGGGKLNQQRRSLHLARLIAGVNDPGLVVTFRDADASNHRRDNLHIGRRGETTLARSVASFENRFWARVTKSGPDDCWVWQGAIHSAGYGRCTRPGKVTDFTHRVAYELANRESPGELFVCHRCDNRPCCNPSHLFLGTHRDNMADMFAKKRNSQPPRLYGEAAHNTLLRNEQVIAIKQALARGEKGMDLARRFGVSPQVISFIKTGRTWSHIKVAS